MTAEQAEELDRRVAAYEQNPPAVISLGTGEGRAAKKVSLPLVWLEIASTEYYEATR